MNIFLNRKLDIKITVLVIFFCSYNHEWYNVPRKSKMLLQMITIRSMRPCTLTAAGITHINLYNFGKVQIL